MMGISRMPMTNEKKLVAPGFSGQAEIMDMIKILSHDIRSPLITIAAGLKLLKKGAYGPVEKGVIEELEKLQEIVIKTAGNRFLLKAVFRNLLRNALKYGGKECRILMDIEEIGDFYRIDVFNTGNLVPVDKRKMLFKKYYRLDSTDKINPDGMGLGLFLVRKILQRHGGKIYYKAEQNGSNFIFSLPKYTKQTFQEDSLDQSFFNNSKLLPACNLSENLS
jgi:sensor histidine kinase regulating citrate/malate metabolism